jgi:hypothetical protein
VPERKRQIAGPAREVVAPVDADRACRVRQRRELREHLGRDRLPRDEEIDRLDPRRARGVDEVLALDDEQPFALALRA